MNENTLVWFGIHYGERLADVPHGYWLYLHDHNLLSGKLKEWVEQEVPVLRFMNEKEKNKSQNEYPLPAGNMQQMNAFAFR
jgi:hypothetical protein